MDILVLLIGFALLIMSADFLVAGASALAKRIGVSDLVIGLTVVAFGTSTPELFVNIFASIQGNTEIAIGNIIGSNIFNILLILGIAALIYPLTVSKNTVWKEIPFSLLAVIVLGILANDTLFHKSVCPMLSRRDGLVFIAFFGMFMSYMARIVFHSCQTQSSTETPINLFKSLGMVIGGLLGLVIGGKIVVNAAVSIASSLGISQSLIGLTIVAAGTSLPELATSAVAAFRKNADIAVGNIVGSNIFNIFFILGISALIKPLPITVGTNSDILILTGASLILFFAMFTGKRRMIDRWEGAIFIALYIAYLILLIQRR